MKGYLISYTKNDSIGHVRYEIGDAKGYKEIRGLSIAIPFIGDTIYEKGEEDSHGISIYDREVYLPSKKIPLTREELIGAIAYTKENDRKQQNYRLLFNNCNDFASGVLSAAGKRGCIGDYLSEEQKQGFKSSRFSDFSKCKIPQKIEDGIEQIKEKGRERMCNGLVYVKSFVRDGELIEPYIRRCGRH